MGKSTKFIEFTSFVELEIFAFFWVTSSAVTLITFMVFTYFSNMFFSAFVSVLAKSELVI